MEQEEKKVTLEEARRESISKLIPMLCKSNMVYLFIGALISEEHLISVEACDDSSSYLCAIKEYLAGNEVPGLKTADRDRLLEIIDDGIAICGGVRSELNK